MSLELRRIRELSELFLKLEEEGVVPEHDFLSIARDMELARQNIAKQMLIEGKTVGQIAVVLAMSPASIVSIAKSL